MNKKNIILVGALGVTALALGLLLAFAVMKYISGRESITASDTQSAVTESTPQDAWSSAAESGQENTETTEPETVSPLEEQLAAIHAAMDARSTEYEENTTGLRVFIGDSRMVGLQQSVYAVEDPERDVFICKGAQFYEYFRDECEPQLKNLIATENVSEVYINMGVNDAANNCEGWKAWTVNNYVTDINQLVADYPSVRFYFVSVGLVDGLYYGNRKIPPDELNVYIREFNRVMKEYCVAYYIPCSEYLEEQGVSTADGVHYDGEVNRMIYAYMVGYTTE